MYQCGIQYLPERMMRSRARQAVTRAGRESAAMMASMSASIAGSAMPARVFEPLSAAACEEKYERSARILDMARAALESCSPGNPLLPSDASGTSTTAPARVTNEAAESVLTLAETWWRARNEACPAHAGDEDVLNLLMKKLTA